MDKEKQLTEELKKLKKERDAFASALTTSNMAFMEKVKEFSIIKRLADCLTVGRDKREMCSEVVDIIIDETNAENCSLWLMDKAREQLALYAVRGQDDLEPRVYGATHPKRSIKVGKGAAGWAARHGTSLLIENVVESPYFIPSETDTSIRSLLCLPIKHKGLVIGVLNMSHPEIGVFSEENERVLQLITDQAAVVLANFSLFEEIQALNRDLEHKVKERTLHLTRSEERYERAITAGKVGIWDWKVGSRQMYVAPNLMAMLGYDNLGPDYNLNKWLKHIHPIDRKRFLKDIISNLKGEAEVFEGEHRMYHADGHIVWFFMRGAVVRDEKGRITRVAGSNSDISKRKKAEMELSEAQEEALVNAHAAGKAEFATTVLHNIGNVLNSVNVDSDQIRKTTRTMRLNQLVMAFELIMENLEDLGTYLTQDERGKKLPEYLERVGKLILRDAGALETLSEEITTKVELMRDIIETQQNFARVNQGARKQDLSHLIEEAVKIQAQSIRKNKITLDQKFRTVPPLVVNSAKLIHVLINLVKNSVEAMAEMPVGGRVLFIETGEHSEGAIYLQIRDTGTGITEDALGQMFTHGFTTKRQGHGFGLHYCRKTIEAMGGTIEVESPGADQGATFTISFPPDAPVRQLMERKEKESKDREVSEPDALPDGEIKVVNFRKK